MQQLKFAIVLTALLAAATAVACGQPPPALYAGTGGWPDAVDPYVPSPVGPPPAAQSVIPAAYQAVVDVPVRLPPASDVRPPTAGAEPCSACGPVAGPTGDAASAADGLSGPPEAWCCSPCCEVLSAGFLARAYFVDDQRIEFSGQEATFGVEGALKGAMQTQAAGWDVGLEGEFFLNQRFDRNVLLDSPERQSYRANFDVDTFEISQLYFRARQGDWYLALGKMPTPFGRAYFPLYLNNRQDAPFIRTEAIGWRETCLLAQYDPSIFVFTVALANGCEDRDTNSSKALIARVGLDTEMFTLGGSVKFQDGVGSESQKEERSHAGVDAAIRMGRWVGSPGTELEFAL